MYNIDNDSERGEPANEEGLPISSIDVLNKHVSKRGVFKSPDPAYLAKRRDELEGTSKRLTEDGGYVSN